MSYKLMKAMLAATIRLLQSGTGCLYSFMRGNDTLNQIR